MSDTSDAAGWDAAALECSSCFQTSPQRSANSADCRAVEAVPRAAASDRLRGAGLLTTVGAAISAILSSACCWLPLLLIAFGASAAGVSGFFEAYRPHLLGVTVLFLGGGFYLAYFRKPRCEPGDACAAPNPRLVGFNKIMLWVAAALVLVFALFPSYVGLLLGAGGDGAAVSPEGRGGSSVYTIEGMTCEACAVTLRTRLSRLAGVAGADVSFASKRATLHLDGAVEPPSDEAIRRAISDVGYQGTHVTGETR